MSFVIRRLKKNSTSGCDVIPPWCYIMKKKLRSAFKTSKYPYIEQKHDGPQEITVLFNTIVKIKDVVLSFNFEVNNFFC